MRRRCLTILVAMSFLLVPNSGCLSLSLFNHDSTETQTRIETLEKRVSALESSLGQRPAEPIVTPQPGSPPTQAGRAQ